MHLLTNPIADLKKDPHRRPSWNRAYRRYHLPKSLK